jgi:arylsulfatase A
MKIFSPLGWLFCLGVVFVSGLSALAADKAPNIVLIFADDQGYQDIGCFGSPLIKTPNLDKMADDGMRFTDFHVGSPVCSASRAALLTGSYCARVGVTGVLFPRHTTGLNPEEITIADLMKSKGYATACIGKWHLGHHAKFLPTNNGFDSYFGIPYSNDMTIDPNAPIAKDALLREGMTVEKIRVEKPKKNWVPLMRNEEVIEYPCDQTQLTKRYTAEAINFITENKEGPFFLYLPHTMPHIPLFVSKKFVGHNKERGLYGDVIEEMDWSVGQVLKTLKKLKLEENTLVVYTSDNGPWLSKGENGGSALPLRDGKFTTYEGGMRVPCIMRWKGQIPSGTECKEIAATIDLLPTFSHFAGASVPTDRVIDGKNISDLMLGKSGAKSPHEILFHRDAAARRGNWKLMLKGRSTVKGQPAGPFPALYNLSTDLSETKNLAEQHPEIVKELSAAIAAHNAEIKTNSRPIGELDNAAAKPSKK